MLRDKLVVILGNFLHEDNELLDFLGLCAGFFLIAAMVTL